METAIKLQYIFSFPPQNIWKTYYFFWSELEKDTLWKLEKPKNLGTGEQVTEKCDQTRVTTLAEKYYKWKKEQRSRLQNDQS